MSEIEGRSLVGDFEAQWARIDAYEKRIDLVPGHIRDVVDVAMALYDEIWRVEGPDEQRIQALYEDLGRVGYEYREREGQR